MQIEASPVEAAKMTKVQKLAAFLIILGPESAAQILKNFNANELESVSLEMSRLTVISQELQQEILREFTEVAIQASSAVLGGVNFTKTALEKSVGLFRASDIISRVAPAPVPVAPSPALAASERAAPDASAAVGDTGSGPCQDAPGSRAGGYVPTRQ